MSGVTQIFNGGESPLAAEVKATAAPSSIPAGPAQGATSDGGPAPDPATGRPAQPSGATTEPPLGGVARARKS